MSRVILRPEKLNWGLICFGVDWDKAVWKVRNNASFSLTVFYGRDEETRKERTGALGPEE